MKKKTIISIYGVFFILITGAAFGQVPDLSLDPSDIRFEPVYSNGTVLGYNLFVRRKPGMASVMLTETSGNYALRSMEWNPINGSERRELSGIPLFEVYSRYSILSSTPVYDVLFGSAFHLFIPLRVVYGNPSSSAGTVFLHISNGVQINIRTFDHQYADPNTGRFQNNLTLINTLADYYLGDYFGTPPVPPDSAQPPTRNLDTLRIELRETISNKGFLDRMSDTELVDFLIITFEAKEREQRNN